MAARCVLSSMHLLQGKQTVSWLVCHLRLQDAKLSQHETNLKCLFSRRCYMMQAVVLIQVVASVRTVFHD